MRKALLFGAMLLASIVSLGGAHALAGSPGLSGIEALRAVTPAAMCGRSCESGGRYIPGPPEVCYDRGLRYCGSSRGGPTLQIPGVAIEVPGIGIEFGGPTVGRGVNCRELRYACLNKEGWASRARATAGATANSAAERTYR